MLRIEIITVGKLKEEYLRMAQAEYSKRLTTFCKLTITELKEYRLPENPSLTQIEQCIVCEGEEILNRIPKSAIVIPLCIEAKQINSEELAKQLLRFAVDGESYIIFVIGGSYGLSDAVKQRGNMKLSMSLMTFPHQLARIMLLEQIYRSFTINAGTKYHK
ncbi:MAG: 23S rRNA (pseudouridine(1915)-N(3))-methyltransferase RlmH [Oscillospiraceae bacterium]